MIEVRRCTAAEVAMVAATEPEGADVVVRQFARQERGESVLLVAWDGDIPIGSGELVVGEDAELRNLHVNSAARGRGAGSAIIAAAEREARIGGSRSISVGVGVDNLDARRLYERLGFHGTGELTTTTYRYVDASGEHEATETDERLTKSPASNSGP